jgi:hypothetical protein
MVLTYPVLPSLSRCETGTRIAEWCLFPDRRSAQRPSTALYAGIATSHFNGERPETDLVCTAFHEAAHALMVHGLGGFVTKVDGAGQTSYAWPAEPAQGALRTERMREMVRAVVLYGGPVAEELARRPGELPGTVAMVQACLTLPYLHGGGAGRDPHHDLERVADIVRRKFDSESDSIFRYLMTAARVAEDLVRVHWETIERVAHHALRWGTVDGPMFKTLVAGRIGRGDLRQTLRAAQF